MILPTARRQLGIHNSMLTAIGHQSIRLHMNIRFKRHRVIEILDGRKFYGTYRSRFLELHLYPMRFSFLCRWKAYITLLSFHQFLPWEITVTFHLSPFQRLTGISFRSRESQYGDIPIVTPFFLVGLGYSKHLLNILSKHIGTTIHNGTHRIFRFNPWSTGHRPTRTILHGETQAQTFSLFSRMLHGSIPMLTQASNAIGRSRPSSSKLSMKQLYA